MSYISGSDHSHTQTHTNTNIRFRGLLLNVNLVQTERNLPELIRFYLMCVCCLFACCSIGRPHKEKTTEAVAPAGILHIYFLCITLIRVWLRQCVVYLFCLVSRKFIYHMYLCRLITSLWGAVLLVIRLSVLRTRNYSRHVSGVSIFVHYSKRDCACGLRIQCDTFQRKESVLFVSHICVFTELWP